MCCAHAAIRYYHKIHDEWWSTCTCTCTCTCNSKEFVTCTMYVSLQLLILSYLFKYRGIPQLCPPPWISSPALLAQVPAEVHLNPTYMYYTSMWLLPIFINYWQITTREVTGLGLLATCERKVCLLRYRKDVHAGNNRPLPSISDHLL
jgi:hypothetical protein